MAPLRVLSASTGSSATLRSTSTIRTGSTGTVRTCPPSSVSQCAYSLVRGSLRTLSR